MINQMAYAFLFDADAINYDSWYGRDIEKNIWQCDIIQNLLYQTKIYYGDVILSSEYDTVLKVKRLAETLFQDTLKKEKAGYLLIYGNIYSWTVEGMKECDARHLEDMLKNDTGYLGMEKVDYRDGVRRYFYRDMLLPRYIIDGKTIKLIVDPFDEENHDEEKEFLHKFAFICMLSFDVYVKKQVIENLIDQMSEEETN